MARQFAHLVTSLYHPFYPEMIYYYMQRFNLTVNSWKYWMTTPYANLEKLSSPYTVGELYWSIRKNGETIAANFWYMLNDGYYDMEDEFFDC